MTKFEVTDEMVEAAIKADRQAHMEDCVHSDCLHAAITAAIEASGLVEENARLRIGLRYLIEHVEQQNSSWDVMAISHAKAALDGPTVKQNLTVQPTKESK
jgi:hypothetical protein